MCFFYLQSHSNFFQKYIQHLTPTQYAAQFKAVKYIPRANQRVALNHRPKIYIWCGNYNICSLLDLLPKFSHNILIKYNDQAHSICSKAIDDDEHSWQLSYGYALDGCGFGIASV